MGVRFKTISIMAATAVLTFAPSVSQAQKKSRDLITHDEIMASAQKDQDLVKVIQALRPHFLEPPRGIRTMGNSFTYPVVVYVDGIKQPGLDALITVVPADVREVRYLDPTRSMSEYGQNANGGAIVVKMMSSKKDK